MSNNLIQEEDKNKKYAEIHEKLSSKLNASLRSVINLNNNQNFQKNNSVYVKKIEKTIKNVGGEVRKKDKEITQAIKNIENKKTEASKISLLYQELYLAEKYLIKKNEQILKLKQEINILRQNYSKQINDIKTIENTPSTQNNKNNTEEKNVITDLVVINQEQNLKSQDQNYFEKINTQIKNIEDNINKIKQNTSKLIIAFEKSLRSSQKDIKNKILQIKKNKKINKSLIKKIKKQIIKEKSLAENEWYEIRVNFPIYIKKKLYKLVLEYNNLDKLLDKTISYFNQNKKLNKKDSAEDKQKIKEEDTKTSLIEQKITKLESSIEGLINMLDNKNYQSKKVSLEEKIKPIYKEINFLYLKIKEDLDDKNVINKFKRAILFTIDNLLLIQEDLNEKDIAKMQNIMKEFEKIKDFKDSDFVNKQKEIEKILENLKNFHLLD